MSFFFILFLSFATSHLLLASSYFPLNIELKDPTFENGTLLTDQGGVIKGQGFYVQGRNLSYTKKESSGGNIHQITAQDDLMVDLDGQIFLADFLFYDIEKKEGYILNGKTSFPPWYIEAKKIILYSDQSFEVLEGTITTSAYGKETWKMQADRLHLTHDKVLTAKSLSIKVLETPIFWFPLIKSNLGSSLETPYKYSIAWDAGQGPIASFRYKIFSMNRFNVYARAEYRYKRGPGGSIEMDYKSNDKLTFFQSKNYVCNETFYNDDDPNKRIKKFRLQGILKKTSLDGAADLDLVYDRYSDKNLPQDFKMDEFELNTQKQNRLITRYNHPAYQVAAKVRPRVNGFDGYNQELPSLSLHVKPILLSPLPLVMFNSFKLCYYDYVYSNILIYPPIYTSVLKDFHAVRAESRQKFLLPLHWKGLDVSPYLGLIGIGYNNSPDDHSILQGVLDYGCQTQLGFFKKYKSIKHHIRPYLNYQGIYKPVHLPRDVYIFSIDDGYHSLNLLRLGCSQYLLSLHEGSKNPFLTCDFYALGFVNDFTFRNIVPKAGFSLGYHQQNLKLLADIRWNFNNKVLDFSNLQLDYTYSANLALHLEYRYRSSYDWRKNNHEDFTLDVTRPIDELLHSPLSDQRQTFITKLEVKLTPNWTCQLQTHHGWGRKKEPNYNEAKLNLITSLSTAWRLKMYYMYTTRGGSHVGMKIDLIQ